VEGEDTLPAQYAQITESKLVGWRQIDQFCRLIEKALVVAAPLGKRAEHGLRRLDARRYLGLFLLGLLNPVIESMRGLCAASALARVTREVSGGKVALSRFSEAQHVFEPDLLRKVFSELLAGRMKSSLLAVRGGPKGGVNLEMLRIVDSTLWKVIPRMKWANWRFQGVGQQAVRLHIKLCVADGSAGAEGAQPADARITTGKGCERKALRTMLKPGELYIGDRNYGEHYAMFEELAAAGCGFLIRLCNTAILHWEKEPTQTLCDPADTSAGTLREGKARLGARPTGRAWRILQLERAGQETVTLIASEEFEKMSAPELAELYRKRWQIEGFFRWLKCLIPCRHWFAESEGGVSLQIYLCLISGLLLAEATGRLPNKRMKELISWHQMGLASDEELTAGLAQYAREAARKRELAAAKKSTAKKQTPAH
jgi:Transposase DDE domain